MPINKPTDIPARDITPKNTYFNRRTLLRAAGLTASVAATGALYRLFNPAPAPAIADRPGRRIAFTNPTTQPDRLAQGYFTDEPRTPRSTITHYNNFYEFSTDKEEVAALAANFVARPWTLTVDGLVGKPRTFDIDQILHIAPPEERVYRHRCVEAWSMVIPWLGFPLSALLKQVEPRSSAKFVAFQTLLDPKQFPNQTSDILSWPYLEGLRLDEAMHPLTILAIGLYGEELPAQNGAPLRLVCPWKYGFKGCKSIVRIALVADQPPTTWNIANPPAYGFYSNVNPAINHPWSQASERRLPDFVPRPTLLFNGYAAQVASLYSGMDLTQYY